MCNSIGNLAGEFHSALEFSVTGLLVPSRNTCKCIKRSAMRCRAYIHIRPPIANVNALLAREPNASTNDCLTTLFFLAWRSVTHAYLSLAELESTTGCRIGEKILFFCVFFRAGALLQFNIADCGTRCSRANVA